ncbi:MAG: histidinol-phosphate transaminase [Methanomicrobiales archaeon]
MKRSVRECYQSEGYVFAKNAAEIGKKHGIERVARLASNENPDPLSEVALKLGYEALSHANRYPDERQSSLNEALIAVHGNYPFVTGVGMDGVIETTIRTLVEPGDLVAISTPTFSFYRLSAIAQGAGVVEVLRGPGFTVEPDPFIEACEEVKLAFLCTPNNPTGNGTSVEVIREILEHIGCVLFLDNAYVEFSDLDYLPLLREYDNLIIGRTFSKAYSLAGLRVGYAFVPEWFRPYYLRAATPHTLNAVSAAAAVGALSDIHHVDTARARVQRLRKELSVRLNYPVMPSDANFIMVDVAPLTSDEAVERLARMGVLVRSCRSFRGLEDHYVRVSIGADWENKMCIDAFSRLNP